MNSKDNHNAFKEQNDHWSALQQFANDSIVLRNGKSANIKHFVR